VILFAVLVLATLAGATRLLTGPWSQASEAIEPWRADLAERGGVPESADRTASRELLLRMNAENIELRRRLSEYREVADASGLAASQAVVARARVTARSLRRGRHFLEIDLGAVDGVEDGMAVGIGWSLIGVVAGEQLGRSLVRLLSDQDSRVAAHLVPAPSDDGEQLQTLTPLALGVCAGTGERGRLELHFIEDRPGLQVEPGMGVLTAGGSGSQLPPRLVIGTVLSAEREATSDHWRIAVQPLRDARQASTLLILRSQRAAVKDGAGGFGN